jgi:hypothetical protein
LAQAFGCIGRLWSVITNAEFAGVAKNPPCGIATLFQQMSAFVPEKHPVLLFEIFV